MLQNEIGKSMKYSLRVVLQLDESFRASVDHGNINITLTTVRRNNYKFIGVRDNGLESRIRCNEQSISTVTVFRKMERRLKGS